LPQLKPIIAPDLRCFSIALRYS